MSEREVNEILKAMLKWVGGIAGSVVVVLVLQTGALIYWCGATSTSIENLNKEVARHESEITVLQSQIYHRSVQK